MATIDENTAQRIVRVAFAADGGPVELSGAPVRLEGGHSADLFSFRLSKGTLADRLLVLRVPSGPGWEAEAIVQHAVAEAGYRTPPVHRSGVTDDGEPYLVMEHIAGKLMIRDVRPHRMMRDTADRLAALMLGLDELEETEVEQALLATGNRAVDVTERTLAEVTAAAGDDPAAAKLSDWLADHRPRRDATVICHGDLHAFNVVVVDGIDHLLDWELSGVGDPRRQLHSTHADSRPDPGVVRSSPRGADRDRTAVAA